jgi:hypothetical protein
MPYSYSVYTGNGTNDQFAVSFSYIRKEHVFASVNYVNATFTWVNSSTIQLDSVPANAARVEVRRVTPVANPLVDFTDGSTLVAADLDTVTLQQTYINQEQDDQFQDAVFINSQGLLDAGGKRITNVGDPVNAQDVATKTYVDTTTVASAGDTMTGSLAMGGNKVTGLGAPTASTDAATRGYVDGVALAGTVPDGDRGDITVSGVGTVWTINNGTIVDADVNASAGIVATKLSFTQAGTGATVRTVDSKLKDVVSVKDFGAVGDGVADDTAAIQAAITAAAGKVLLIEGTYLVTGTVSISSSCNITGKGELIFDNVTGNSLFVTASDVIIHDITIRGNSPGGVSIKSGAKRVTIDSVTFRDIGQCVWLFACSQVRIVGCYFYDFSSYGIVQQYGSASSYCEISGCVFENGASDAIELNCATAPSYGWIITGNRYLGAAGWPTVGTEKRFVGITNVSCVTITNNYIYAASGDSAIHLEDAGGENIIANNHFLNCLGATGAGIIYVINSSQHVQIANNNIQMTDPALPAQAAISMESGSYSNKSDISGNRFVAKNGAVLTGIDLALQVGRSRVSNNTFEALSVGIIVTGCQQLTAIGNDFQGCAAGIKDVVSATSGSLTDAVIEGNKFMESTGDNINLNRNTNGTGGPKRILIAGNRFDRNVVLNDADDCFATNNQINATYGITFPAAYVGTVRCSLVNTHVIGTGLVP